MSNLRISRLSVRVSQRVIIHDCNVDFLPASFHVIMGPNGSGKSSLASTIMGHPGYSVESGQILFQGDDITAMPVHQRALRGIFLALQHPLEIQGLSVISFLKELYSIRLGQTVSVHQMMDMVMPLLDLVGLDQTIFSRNVNVGFSGGQKKRFELLQMLILLPKVVILDELDSGVDVDGLKHIARALSWYREQQPEGTIIFITHYSHVLDVLTPDYVHIMIDGNIVTTGGPDLIGTIQQHGYGVYEKRS